MPHIQTIYASSVAHLDSNVHTGGGTDDTAALQSVLDIARDQGGVHLIMDGAALVSSLTVYSNTTIECVNAECGFFQIDQTNWAIVTNADWDRQELRIRNVTLLGGTYNQNCLNQVHDVPETPEMLGANCYAGGVHLVCALEFCGVENLLVRDVKIVDFRTYAFMLTNFKYATLEKVWVDLPNRMHAQNQDGLHFWGPGQFLTVRDCGGKVGDDFMNIGPDEGDCVSGITDVLVDGIFVDDADQAIRILSRGTGLVDRCTIRNMQGTYRSFGFYIDCWYPDDGTMGNFGDIFIENIHLTHSAPNYDYRPPMLFSVGGDIRCLTLKNIRHEYPIDNRVIGEFGLPYHTTTPDTIDTYEYTGKKPVIRNLIVDGLTVLENEQSADMDKLVVYGQIDNMIVRNAVSVKDADTPRSGNLIRVANTGHINNLIAHGVFSVGNEKVLDGEARVDEYLSSDVIEK